MSLRPRHYILFAIVLGLFVWNMVRSRQVRQQSSAPAPAAPVVHTASRVNTPAWTAFDQAADLRDADDAQFGPAMKNLEEKIAATPATDGTVSDVKGCVTWLQFYRQGHNHPGADTKWKDRSGRHLDGCLQFHLDTTAQ